MIPAAVAIRSAGSIALSLVPLAGGKHIAALCEKAAGGCDLFSFPVVDLAVQLLTGQPKAADRSPHISLSTANSPRNYNGKSALHLRITGAIMPLINFHQSRITV